MELSLHASHAVISAVLSLLSTLPGLRPAEAGEFTMRAFKSGKMDLTQAEGVHDLVQARTETQRRAAVNRLKVRLLVHSFLEGDQRNLFLNCKG